MRHGKYGGMANRLATPREMAGPIAFLGSEMASYISGICPDNPTIRLQRRAVHGRLSPAISYIYSERKKGDHFYAQRVEPGR